MSGFWNRYFIIGYYQLRGILFAVLVFGSLKKHIIMNKVLKSSRLHSSSLF